MNNEFASNDADAENEELLRALELAGQKLQSADQKLKSSLQQVTELSRQLAETAMARVDGHRRIDLRALRSMDLEPGRYEISTSEPDAPEPQVMLTWIPGTLILGPDLIPTQRDVKLTLPTIRVPRMWQIPFPSPSVVPPPLPPVEPGSMSDAQWLERAGEERARRQAWKIHHLSQTQAAERWASDDGSRASKDEELVAEAMMAEVEARRADPQQNARRTIMDLGCAFAQQFLAASQKNQT